MSEPKASNVPKFASFRPKPTVENDAQKKVSSRQEDESRPHDRRQEIKGSQRSHNRRRDRSKSRDGKPRSSMKDHLYPGSNQGNPRQSYPGPADSEHQIVQTKAVISGHESLVIEPDLFIIDLKGDLKNVVYGSIHKYSVPPFRRYGAGRVLGASLDLKIDRTFLSEKAIILTRYNDNGKSSREKYVFSKMEKERPRLLKIRPEASVGEEDIVEADFVPFRKRGKTRKRGDNGDRESSGPDNDMRDYRSIHGQIKGDAPKDEDLQYTSESASSGSDNEWALQAESSIQQQNIVLARRVEQTPHDIAGWLALIHLQDSLLGKRGDSRRFTSAEIQSTAEIKIHLYEKALHNARSTKDRESLLVGLMGEGAKIWNVDMQATRWKQLSDDNIASSALWIQYLHFKQSTYSTFDFESVRAIYAERVRYLLLAVTPGQVSNTENDNVNSYGTSTQRNAEYANIDRQGALAQQTKKDLYLELIYVVLRLTLFVRESGYRELAVAIWQALIEINFRGPSQPGWDASTVSMFEEFWESERPRAGESGSAGWCHFIENGPVGDLPGSLVDEADDSLTLSNNNIFESWATAERKRSKCSRLPAKTIDDVFEDDPFRVILFSDVEGYLFRLPPDDEGLHLSVFDAFLLFSRLPPRAADSEGGTRDWWNDLALRGEPFDVNWRSLSRQLLDRKSTEGEATNAGDHSLAPSQNGLRSSQSLFTGGTENISYKAQYAGDHGPVSYQWVRNCLKQINSAWFDEIIAEYYISFEFVNEPETIKKICKGLIKKNSTNLRLYHAHGLIEWSKGNKDVAAGVFGAAITMGPSVVSKASKTSDSILIWKSWTWACLMDGNNIMALQVLLSAADHKPSTSMDVSPAHVLRSKQYFSANRDHHLTSNDASRSATYSECLALLAYLTGDSPTSTKSSTQGNIEAAMTVFSSFSHKLQERHIPVVHELYLQSAAQLLLRHARTGSYRPAYLRGILESYIKLFPRNTMFLGIYSWNERRLRIDNRVRDILLNTVLTPEGDCVTSRLFSIHHEINNGTIHSVKSTFEHAIASTATKSSASLWQLYVLFCLRTPQFKAKAKEVWLRSLRACPWSKELYVFGFETLSETISFEEMKSTWRVISEKELRVHVDLEDQFDEIAEKETTGPAHRRVARQ